MATPWNDAREDADRFERPLVLFGRAKVCGNPNCPTCANTDALYAACGLEG
jgi:hypothetical protein